ncbi:DUF2290 domain-containing protein [Aeromonas sp. 600282]|uniref:DUF2290 domain-containing protein n=1 Tax=Aeromonas TaxID=642 RepID=UPI003BA2569B
MNIDALAKEVAMITKDLIREGVCDAPNFPVVLQDNKNTDLVFSGFHDVSIALKDVEYSIVYDYLDKNKQYNMKLVDGALIQLLYQFNRKGHLVKHRLCYFPSPTFAPFQDMPELYMDEGCLYSDIIAKSILPVPVRVDYDPANHQDVIHPKSHMTFGQYKNCRIPVVSPLCPVTFVNFVLSSFYNTAFMELSLKRKHHRFEDSITDNEKDVLHFAIL